MADIVDNAQESIELAEALATLARQQRLKLPTGKCLECDEPTPGSFCCPECRDSYELRDRKSTRLNSSHVSESRMPSSA